MKDCRFMFCASGFVSYFFSCFMLCYHILNMILNVWHCFCIVVIHFSMCNKQTSFEEQHVYSIFLSLIFVGKLRTNLCGPLVLLFSLFMNIVSMLILKQLANLVFYYLLSYKFIVLYDLTNFMLQILVNIFRRIKMKIKKFWFLSLQACCHQCALLLL